MCSEGFEFADGKDNERHPLFRVEVRYSRTGLPGAFVHCKTVGGRTRSTNGRIEFDVCADCLMKPLFRYIGLEPCPIDYPDLASLIDRERLGRVVRVAWVAWAREQDNPKASWLEPWEQLSSPMKEVDRRIGEAVAKHLGSVPCAFGDVEKKDESALRSTIAFAREAFGLDGAEGETVHRLCDQLEWRLDCEQKEQAVASVKTGVDGITLGTGPTIPQGLLLPLRNKEYVTGDTREVSWKLVDAAGDEVDVESHSVINLIVHRLNHWDELWNIVRLEQSKPLHEGNPMVTSCSYCSAPLRYHDVTACESCYERDPEEPPEESPPKREKLTYPALEHARWDRLTARLRVVRALHQGGQRYWHDDAVLTIVDDWHRDILREEASPNDGACTTGAVATEVSRWQESIQNKEYVRSYLLGEGDRELCPVACNDTSRMLDVLSDAKICSEREVRAEEKSREWGRIVATLSNGGHDDAAGYLVQLDDPDDLPTGRGCYVTTCIHSCGICQEEPARVCRNCSVFMTNGVRDKLRLDGRNKALDGAEVSLSAFLTPDTYRRVQERLRSLRHETDPKGT
jgi:hypothetical protein